MSNIEILKQELIKQKELIELKGGHMQIANTNPSPTEITNGISSIEMPNFENTTATEADVRIGKTFYSQNLQMKTGVMHETYTDEYISKIFVYSKEQTTVQKTYYTFPETTTYVKPYLFYKCPNPIVITFSENITEIGEYAFNNPSDLVITNVNDLPNIIKIGSYALRGYQGIDFENLYPSLTTTGSYTFADCVVSGQGLKPPALTTIGTYTFNNTSKVTIPFMDLSNIASKSFSSYCFCNYIINDDLNTIPSNVTTLSSYSFYKTSFNNVEIPATVKTISDYCFSGNTADNPDLYQTKCITFEAEVPPSFGTGVISSYHINNGLKVYVPDVSVEAYKALPKLQNYINIILPLSQRPY